jgi:hypothetical protein
MLAVDSGMMRATRQVLAVVAVTTALCADRVVQAAPVSRPHVAQMASRLVSRLAHRLRRAVTAIVPWQVRQRGITLARRPALVPVVACVPHRTVSPFQFRLPPPTA